jgi:hypothetical protein
LFQTILDLLAKIVYFLRQLCLLIKNPQLLS